MGKESVTKIEVFKTNGNSFTVAFGYITVCDFLRVRFNVSKAKSGNLFVSWPQSSYIKDNETKYINLIEFPDDDDRKDISNDVLKEYNRVIGIVPAKKEEYKSNKPTNENVENKQEESPELLVEKPKKGILKFKGSKKG